ncbi:hypothetical protein IKF03_00300 [Candidatus Saccharibacteria bacterium]|nr:hypothetical protein [Candidatus Saccharibacteria bacterium]
MNENDGGTPNPLNQNPLDANPSESMEQAEPMEEINEVEISETNEIPVRREAGEIDALGHRRPIMNRYRQTEDVVEKNVMVESLDPEGRSMMKAEPVMEEPKPRKKTGLIVGVIVCLFIAVGCGVAAALMMMSGDKDPVATAMKKLMDGKMPTNVAIDGKIEMSINDSTSPISKIDIDLNSQAQTGTTINAATAEVGFTFSDGEEIDFSFDEVHAESGELYFKIDGVTALIEKITLLEMLSNNSGVQESKCVDDGTGETKCLDDVVSCECLEGEICDCVSPDAVIDESMFLDELMGMYGGVVSVIDGQWLKISMDEVTSMSGGLMESDMTCMIDLINGINTNSNSAADLYNKNPFVASTTDGVKVGSKFSQVRQIVINDENFANYVNSVQNTEITKTLYNCLGWESNVSITTSDVAEIVSQLPAIYVEVDGDDNFSRLYFETLMEDDHVMKVDLSFTYPATINVSEPAEYTSFEEVIQTIFTSMYNISGATDAMVETPAETPAGGESIEVNLTF